MTIARATARLNAAAEAAADTFPSKAARKAVLDNLNRAYESAKGVFSDVYLAQLFKNDETFGGMDRWNRAGFLAEVEVPFDLHQVRDRHIAIIARWSPEAAEIVEAARSLREEVKNAEIVPPAPKRDPKEVEAEERVHRSIREEMDRFGVMYASALDIGRHFGGMPVTANVHMVTNQHGTRFIRAFYYLAGKRMPLNLILAAAEQLERE